MEVSTTYLNPNLRYSIFFVSCAQDCHSRCKNPFWKNATDRFSVSCFPLTLLQPPKIFGFTLNLLTIDDVVLYYIIYG